MAVKYNPRVLHEFVTSHRQALIAHCKDNAAKRFAPGKVPAEMAHGVPLFLQQLVDVLRNEQLTSARVVMEPKALPGSTEIGRSAILHGAELLNLGFTLDQVVHGYGDVCQSVTELAIKKHADISADEFRTLNRCLDNAIADSVTAYRPPGRVQISSGSEALETLLGDFSAEHARLIQIVAQSFAAIKTGNIGPGGATGALLVHALEELRLLTERSLSAFRRSSAMV